jgi:aminoglycoside phosphotransferase (APT) family kinase protein
MNSTIKGGPIARGRTADVYAWPDNQVLKLFNDWVPEDWIQRELEIGRALAATSLPTPRLVERVSLDGGRGIVFERVAGPSMLQILTARPWRVVSLARQFAELHSMIHAQSGASFGAGLASVRSSLAATLAQIESVPSQIRDEAMHRLGRLPDGAALCHFDFHPDQIMLTPRGPVILDWMSARQGHPLADVARTLVLTTFGQAPHLNRLMQSLINVFRGAFGRQYLGRYLELQPQATRGQVEAWMLPVAAARLAEDIPGERHAILAFIARSLRRPEAG